MQTNEITEVLNRPTSQELLARDLTRLAYVAKDGTPGFFNRLGAYSVTHVSWPLRGPAALGASMSDPGALSSFCPSVPGVSEVPVGVGRCHRR